jgi:hypothetical protein
VNSQASSPRSDPRPPYNRAGGGEDEHKYRTDAIDTPARATGKQVVVQLGEGGNQPDAEGHRIAEVFPGEGMEQTIHGGGAPRQGNGDGLVRIPRPTDADVGMARIRARRRARQFLLPMRRASISASLTVGGDTLMEWAAQAAYRAPIRYTSPIRPL